MASDHSGMYANQSKKPWKQAGMFPCSARHFDHGKNGHDIITQDIWIYAVKAVCFTTVIAVLSVLRFGVVLFSLNIVRSKANLKFYMLEEVALTLFGIIPYFAISIQPILNAIIATRILLHIRNFRQTVLGPTNLCAFTADLEHRSAFVWATAKIHMAVSVLVATIAISLSICYCTLDTFHYMFVLETQSKILVPFVLMEAVNSATGYLCVMNGRRQHALVLKVWYRGAVKPAEPFVFPSSDTIIKLMWPANPAVHNRDQGHS
ncbi:uncharacterized protein LOC129589689 [Paramacrobiotus metropolitanus]|uniref:uncharacterized protein LOC129589689 n=1 Tax=Paramacrobiotus metropolitanus TaxID=2943436 RepID=UPI0024465197|nr:uncharacterized protein LOC129589689 [Paramacrobiotus metropolitanus]